MLRFKGFGEDYIEPTFDSSLNLTCPTGTTLTSINIDAFETRRVCKTVPISVIVPDGMFTKYFPYALAAVAGAIGFTYYKKSKGE